MTGSGSSRQRHLAARANTLRWADEAAAQGDYVQALDWLAALEAIGDDLPGEYQVRRDEWRTQRERTAELTP